MHYNNSNYNSNVREYLAYRAQLNFQNGDVIKAALKLEVSMTNYDKLLTNFHQLEAICGGTKSPTCCASVMKQNVHPVT